MTTNEPATMINSEITNIRHFRIYHTIPSGQYLNFLFRYFAEQKICTDNNLETHSLS